MLHVVLASSLKLPSIWDPMAASGADNTLGHLFKEAFSATAVPQNCCSMCCWKALHQPWTSRVTSLQHGGDPQQAKQSACRCCACRAYPLTEFLKVYRLLQRLSSASLSHRQTRIMCGRFLHVVAVERHCCRDRRKLTSYLIRRLLTPTYK